MSTITLPNIRVGSDLQVRVSLKDGGVAIDWSTLSNIKACIYSDAQRALAGRCAFSIDEEDNTLLVCTYAANKPQYLGVNRIVISAKYMGETKTYDKPAFSFVRWTADQEGEEITIDDPDVDVEIDVEDISSSILQEAVDAAFTAADRANEAAAAAEHMVDIHTGPKGDKGDTGETPDISIGTVTTVEPGTPASASMSGTPEAPVLNLSIPKGAVGSTPNISIGTVTTGAPGTPVVITITGTAEAPVLNITIPQGMKGDTGVSADYPITIYNGLDSDATEAALSAAQGKVLDGKVSQLQQEVTENCTVDAKRFIVNSEQHIPYKISNGETVIVRVVKAAGSSTAVYARIAQTSTGQVYLRSLQYCDEIEVTATTDYNYIYFYGENLANGAIVDIIRKNNLWQAVKDNTDLTRFQNPSYPCFVATGTNHKDVGAPNVSIYGEGSTSAFPSNFFRCFRSLKLSGFDKTKKYVLSLFRAGYGTTHNDYQIRFAEWDGSSRSNEVTFSITASSISVVGGLNKLSATSGTKKMDAVVDYSCVPLYCSCTMARSENFVVAQECLEKDLADLENEISELQESALTENDLTVSIVSNNIAKPANIRLGEFISNTGGMAVNQDWAMISALVTPGQVITFGGFYLGRSGYYAFYNGTTLVSFENFIDPNGRQNPKTVTVPENANILYVDIKSSASPSDPYSGLMINYGSTLLDYDAYKEAITKIDGMDVYGSETGGGADLSTLIEDLPVSADGSDISAGYAYINSATGAVIVKQ